jgi:hypothetical protein
MMSQAKPDGFLQTAIAEGKWHHAKYLSAVAPHEYIRSREEPELSADLIWSIKERGRDEEFKIYGHKKTYRYLYLDGYKYWYMKPFLEDGTLDPDTVVNRAIGEGG